MIILTFCCLLLFTSSLCFAHLLAVVCSTQRKRACVSLLPIYNLERKRRRRRTNEEETNNGSHTMCFLSTASFVLLGARKEKCFHPNGAHTRSLSLSPCPFSFLFYQECTCGITRWRERERRKKRTAAATQKKKKRIVAT